MPSIARAPAINSDDLEKLSIWISDSGIRWELDGESKDKNWDLPPDDRNTWRFGLDRLLMGVVMGENHGPWQEIQPMEIPLEDAPLLESLCRFMDHLDEFRKEINNQYPIERWLEIIQELLVKFFDPKETEVMLERQLRAALEDLRLETSVAEFKDEMAVKQGRSKVQKSSGDNCQKILTTLIPWFLRISVVRFSLVRFSKNVIFTI